MQKQSSKSEQRTQQPQKRLPPEALPVHVIDLFDVWSTLRIAPIIPLGRLDWQCRSNGHVVRESSSAARISFHQYTSASPLDNQQQPDQYSHPHQWYRNPYLYIFVVSLQLLDATSTSKPATAPSCDQVWTSLRSFIDKCQRFQLEFLIICTTHSTQEETPKYTRILDKLRFDVNQTSKLIDRVVTISLPQQQQQQQHDKNNTTRLISHLHNSPVYRHLLLRLRDVVRESSQSRIRRYDDEISKLYAKSKSDADWSLTSYYLLDEALAFVYSQLGRRDIALKHYEQMYAMLSDHTVPYTAFCDLSPADVAQGLSNRDFRPYRNMLETGTITELDLHTFFFAHMFALLIADRKFTTLAEKAIKFISYVQRRCNDLSRTSTSSSTSSVQITQVFRDIWVFTTARIVSTMLDPAVPRPTPGQTTSTSQLTSYRDRYTVRLVAGFHVQALRALQNLSQIVLPGCLSAAEPSPVSDGSELKHLVQQAMSTSNHKLRKALSSRSAAELLHSEISNAAASLYEMGMRARGAASLDGDTGYMHLLNNNYTAAEAPLSAQCSRFMNDHGWDLLHRRPRQRLAQVEKKLHRTQEYLVSCLTMLFMGRTSRLLVPMAELTDTQVEHAREEATFWVEQTLQTAARLPRLMRYKAERLFNVVVRKSTTLWQDGSPASAIVRITSDILADFSLDYVILECKCMDAPPSARKSALHRRDDDDDDDDDNNDNDNDDDDNDDDDDIDENDNEKDNSSKNNNNNSNNNNNNTNTNSDKNARKNSEDGANSSSTPTKQQSAESSSSSAATCSSSSGSSGCPDTTAASDLIVLKSEGSVCIKTGANDIVVHASEVPHHGQYRVNLVSMFLGKLKLVYTASKISVNPIAVTQKSSTSKGSLATATPISPLVDFAVFQANTPFFYASRRKHSAKMFFESSSSPPPQQQNDNTTTSTACTTTTVLHLIPRARQFIPLSISANEKGIAAGAKLRCVLLAPNSNPHVHKFVALFKPKENDDFRNNDIALKLKSCTQTETDDNVLDIGDVILDKELKSGETFHTRIGLDVLSDMDMTRPNRTNDISNNDNDNSNHNSISRTNHGFIYEECTLLAELRWCELDGTTGRRFSTQEQTSLLFKSPFRVSAVLERTTFDIAPRNCATDSDTTTTTTTAASNRVQDGATLLCEIQVLRTTKTKSVVHVRKVTLDTPAFLQLKTDEEPPHESLLPCELRPRSELVCAFDMFVKHDQKRGESHEGKLLNQRQIRTSVSDQDHGKIGNEQQPTEDGVEQLCSDDNLFPETLVENQDSEEGKSGIRKNSERENLSSSPSSSLISTAKLKIELKLEGVVDWTTIERRISMEELKKERKRYGIIRYIQHVGEVGKVFDMKFRVWRKNGCTDEESLLAEDDEAIRSTERMEYEVEVDPNVWIIVGQQRGVIQVYKNDISTNNVDDDNNEDGTWTGVVKMLAIDCGRFSIPRVRLYDAEGRAVATSAHEVVDEHKQVVITPSHSVISACRGGETIIMDGRRNGEENADGGDMPIVISSNTFFES